MTTIPNTTNLTVTEADLTAIRAATFRSRFDYLAEVEHCEEGGSPLVYVTSKDETRSIRFLVDHERGRWGALNWYGEELATGPTIRAIMKAHGRRLIA